MPQSTGPSSLAANDFTILWQTYSFGMLSKSVLELVSRKTNPVLPLTYLWAVILRCAYVCSFNEKVQGFLQYLEKKKNCRIWHSLPKWTLCLQLNVSTVIQNNGTPSRNELLKKCGLYYVFFSNSDFSFTFRMNTFIYHNTYGVSDHRGVVCMCQ